MHWLHIDVSGLIGKSDSSRRFAATGTIEGLVTGLGKVDEADPVDVDLTLYSREDSIAARGEVRGRFVLTCSRCLVEYGKDFEVELHEQFYFDPKFAEVRDGYTVGGDQTVDLEPMLRDAIVLNIPVKPVHAEDCKGLCPVCGNDLNVGSCDHGEEPVDIRWAALKDLVVDEQ